MNEEELKQVGRIAFRSEGAFWNAYYAKPDTMDGAILLGSIRFVAVLDKPERKQAFMDLMRDTVADAVHENFGISPSWDVGPAPEHEKSGNA